MERLRILGYRSHVVPGARLSQYRGRRVELTGHAQSLESPVMSPALAMTSGNPALSAETFRAAPALARADAMTIEGTVNKTAISLAILFVAATWVWTIGVGD